LAGSRPSHPSSAPRRPPRPRRSDSHSPADLTATLRPTIELLRPVESTTESLARRAPQPQRLLPRRMGPALPPTVNPRELLHGCDGRADADPGRRPLAWMRRQDPDNDPLAPEPLQVHVDQPVVQARHDEAERAPCPGDPRWGAEPCAHLSLAHAEADPRHPATGNDRRRSGGDERDGRDQREADRQAQTRETHAIRIAASSSEIKTRPLENPPAIDQVKGSGLCAPRRLRGNSV